MKELLEYMARSLVDQPEAVRVDVVENDNVSMFELHVHPEDIGKVIGKQGRIAKAIRTLVKAAGVIEGKRANVEIID